MRRTALLAALATSLLAQTFDVASIKPSPPRDIATTNVPLGPGDVFTPTGGLLDAQSQTLVTYIAFAYRLAGNQIQKLAPQLPGWANTERFDIQARASGNPGKDQM